MKIMTALAIAGLIALAGCGGNQGGIGEKAQYQIDENHPKGL